MKRIIVFMLCAVMLCISCNAEQYSYYCMRKKNHQRPCLESGFEFITENGGYYIGKDEKVIYLTFDAGYENGNVSKILEVLDRRGVKAAFFVLENLIKKEPELIKQMDAGGHLVCNHTAKHPDVTKLSREGFESEICRLETVCMEYAGVKLAKYFRPPEGKFNQKSLEYANEMGYKTVFWSFAYADWDNSKQPDREYAKQLMLDNTHNGAIFLLHPTSETNADIIDEMITCWTAMGYRFGTLDEL